MFVLGIVAALLFTLWVGLYCLIICLPITILELPYAPLAFMAKGITFFQDYRFRVAFYVM
jgi:hypothetical protein